MNKLAEGGRELTIKDTRDVIKAMVEDVKLESIGEIEWTSTVASTIGKVSAQLFKKRISKIPL
jgi:hypothetical protein